MRFRNDDIFSPMGNIKDFVKERKVKKFFRIVLPIIIVEILALVGLGVYIFKLPKNYCTITTNIKYAQVYVNDKKINKFRISNPKEKTDVYFYDVDVSILLPGNEAYKLTISVYCSKYNVDITTPASRVGKEYSMVAVGGDKTQILSSITISSKSLIKDFEVFIGITAEKL
ncbi:MAG: hypothetical protein IKY10_03050 [Clostridia bacterium]|nr:hypothetical protein [Clostridia bacterium]